MKGYYRLDEKDKEIFYVSYNFILTKFKDEISIDYDPNHLKELSLYFRERDINQHFTNVVDVPYDNLRRFRDNSFRDNPCAYLDALEIFDLAKEEIESFDEIGEYIFE